MKKEHKTPVLYSVRYALLEGKAHRVFCALRNSAQSKAQSKAQTKTRWNWENLAPVRLCFIKCATVYRNKYRGIIPPYTPVCTYVYTRVCAYVRTHARAYVRVRTRVLRGAA